MRNTHDTPDVAIADETLEVAVVDDAAQDEAVTDAAGNLEIAETDAAPAESAESESESESDAAATDDADVETCDVEVVADESGDGDAGDSEAGDGEAVAAAPGASDAEVTGSQPPRRMIDPRGPRFGAAITVVVLALVLVTIPSVVSVVLLVWQAIAFGAASFFGIQAQPYGILYRSSVAPRLGPPKELEDAAPPRFAQQVGLVFVLVALVGLAFSLPVVAYIATAFALAAAFLNAAFNFCLGCEIYLLGRRFRRA